MISEPTAADQSLDLQTSQRRRMWRAGFVALLAAAAAAVVWWQWAGLERTVDGQRLRLAQVVRGDLVRDALVDGRAVAAASPTLYAPAAGTVALQVRAGDAVKAGQVLARIDSPALAAERAREVATLQQLDADQGRLRIDAQKQLLLAERETQEARLAVQTAKRDEERTREACLQGVVAQADCLRRRDAFQAAQIRGEHATRAVALEAESAGFEQQSLVQRVARQRGVVAELDRRLAEQVVRSPVQGRVGSIAVADRASVAAATPLMTVVDLSQLEVELQVPEAYAADLGAGMRVDLRIGETTTRGELSAIAPEVRAGQVQVRARWQAGAPEGVRQNQRLSARIVIDERPGVLTLPRGPFVEAGGGHSLYVMEGEHAVRRTVRLGALGVAAVEVADGLRAGDRVVTAGFELFDGAPRVRVRP